MEDGLCELEVPKVARALLLITTAASAQQVLVHRSHQRVAETTRTRKSLLVRNVAGDLADGHHARLLWTQHAELHE